MCVQGYHFVLHTLWRRLCNVAWKNGVNSTQPAPNSQPTVPRLKSCDLRHFHDICLSHCLCLCLCLCLLHFVVACYGSTRDRAANLNGVGSFDSRVEVPLIYPNCQFAFALCMRVCVCLLVFFCVCVCVCTECELMSANPKRKTFRTRPLLCFAANQICRMHFWNANNTHSTHSVLSGNFPSSFPFIFMW